MEFRQIAVTLCVLFCLFIVTIESRSGERHRSSFESSFHHKKHRFNFDRWTPFSNNHSSHNSSETNEIEPSESDDHERHERPQRSSPIVHTSWATIEGIIETHAGANVSAFYGIPFAEPPVGKLRFRLPVKVEGRHRGIYNATAPKPACMQSKHGKDEYDEPVSEDCLYLNVWAPREDDEDDGSFSRWSRKSSSRGNSERESWSSHRESSSSRSKQRKGSRGYPVLFYIYGSQFKKHSATFSISRGGVTAAQGKMIFVNCNYRLQSFGFAFGGDRHMPGNQAIYDVLAALEWTRENIASFGGDPDRITISGSSAGSELAALMALSPDVSPFLFDQVVLMSAVPMRLGSIESQSVALNKTKTLAAKLGCEHGHSRDSFRLSYEQMDCLQRVNATDIAEADSTEDMTILGSCPDFAFMPIYGDEFMPSSPDVLLVKGQVRRHVKYMIGSDHNDDVETDNYQPTSRDEVEENLDNMLANMLKPRHNISRELDYLYDYYFEDVSDNDTWTLKERMSQLIGDNMFQCPLWLYIEKLALIDPVHYYYYNYTADAYADSTEVKYMHGPDHGSANWMFLGLPFTEEGKYSDRDRLVSIRMIKILSDFVHEGEINWPPVLVSKGRILPLEWIVDEKVDTHNVKVSPKLNICRFFGKLYHVY